MIANIESLQGRTLAGLKALHVLKVGDLFTCLDFNLTARSVEESIAGITAWIADHRTEQGALPAAPAEQWIAYSQARQVDRWMISCQTERGRAFVLVRE